VIQALAKAKEYTLRALRIKEAAYGPDHPQVAITLGNLGLVARDQGDLAEARRLQERALRIKEAAHGPDHPQVAITLANLGLVARDQGDLAMARRLMKRALRIEEAIYGPDHTDVARTLTGLCIVAKDQGDLAEARHLQERALSIFTKAHGDDHPHTQTTRKNLRVIEEQISGPQPEARSISETEGVPMTQPSNQTPVPTIGIITALPHEAAAVRAMLGDLPEFPVPGSGAGRRYWATEISAKHGVHRVVVAQTSGQGNNHAAIRASQLLAHFPTVQSIIMCGIAAGVPHPDREPEHDVRLGDIIVSNQKGVVQYDFVKRAVDKDSGEVFEEVRASPIPPSAELLDAVQILETETYFEKRPWEQVLTTGLATLKWTRPDSQTDPLNVESGQTEPVPPLNRQRRPGQPRIFRGPVAAANILLKDPTTRERLRKQFGAKAVEMESSGIADATWNHGVGYLVVRGVCDYGDGTKKDLWQQYAALAAAAYVRALLESMPGTAASPQ
jgi:nucleoside phosphorylase